MSIVPVLLLEGSSFRSVMILYLSFPTELMDF